MNSFFVVLKNAKTTKPIGYLRTFFDGQVTTLQVTITSLKSEGRDVFAVAFSVDGDELCRKQLTFNGITCTLECRAEKVDLIIVADGDILSFANLCKVNSDRYYLSRFLACDSLYDDEAIAEENYYLLEKNYNLSEGFYYAKQGAENDLSFDGNQSQKEKATQKNFSALRQDDDNKKSCLAPYYKLMQKKVDGAFLRYRCSHKLTKTLPNSRFFELCEGCKTLFGVQYDNGKPLYFIYAVRAKKDDEIFIKLKGKACFLPCSIFDLSSDGYCCLFQDAKTGLLIKNP